MPLHFQNHDIRCDDIVIKAEQQKISEMPRFNRLQPSSDFSQPFGLEDSAVNEINTVLDSYVQGLPVKKVQRSKNLNLLPEDCSETFRRKIYRSKKRSSKNVDGRLALVRESSKSFQRQETIKESKTTNIVLEKTFDDTEDKMGNVDLVSNTTS